VKSLRIFSLLLLLLVVNQCANNRSHTGAFLGATTSTVTCLQFTDNPVIAAACAVTGAFVGAELMYDSDYDVHNAVFVDHLNTSPHNKQSYTNWYNEKTANSGNIKTYSTYLEGPFKCKDYEATIDITSQWPLIGIGGINRKVVFGTACQQPDGRWVERDNNGRTN
jgi:surface antigen